MNMYDVCGFLCGTGACKTIDVLMNLCLFNTFYIAFPPLPCVYKVVDIKTINKKITAIEEYKEQQHNILKSINNT